MFHDKISRMMNKATISIPDSAGGAEHLVEVNSVHAAQFASRLRKVARERRKWAKREGILCYRIYDADLPDYAVAIDVYTAAQIPQEYSTKLQSALAPGEIALHLAEYQAPKTVDEVLARERLEDIIAIAPVVLGIPSTRLFCKTRRKEKGGGQYSQPVLHGSQSAHDFCDEQNSQSPHDVHNSQSARNSQSPHGTRNPRVKQTQYREPFPVVTQEGSCILQADLNSYLDTGIFLDHRPTRLAIAAESRGKRFLNLFAYTGCASVQAAAGRATAVTTVDLSQTYLNWARTNMEANGFTGKPYTYERADVLPWLATAAEKHRQWDLVFVDPPTFSNSKSMGQRTWDVQRDHVELLCAIKRVLAPGGTIIFSNNLRSFKPDEAALAAEGLHLRDVTQETIPEDFARNRKIHHCYRITR